ncbi:DUF1624 domain-containing protein [Vallicoccus soli]|uniref:DUF1624 domain-containing protein n=2 Tax=Vallicoccus soli TaxID=2339232 RepID=A0A3A3ZBD3_9ACTN|nr:DUF1624 domain-containing protein [Vallicoccus soli]
MMAVHVLPDVDPDGSTSLAYLLASGRAAALFALLAGVGLALAHGGSRRLPQGRGWAADGAGLAVRAACIGLVGLLLGEVDSGVAVILPYYAVLFVLAVPLLGLRPPALVGVAVAAAAVVPVLSHDLRRALPAPDRTNPTLADLAAPGDLLRELLLTGYYPALPWVAYVATGLAVGRLALGAVRVQAGLLAVGAALALGAAGASSLLLGPLGGRAALEADLAGYPPAEVDRLLASSQYGTTPPGTWWWLALDAPHSSTPLDLLHTTGTSLAVLGAVLLLARVAGPLLVPLAAAGGMTLSLYSAHVLLLSSGLLPAEPLASWLVQCAAALAGATAWRLAVGRGPLEAAVAGLVRPVRRAVGGVQEPSPRGSVER